MKSVQYVFDRDRMEDPVDHTKWTRGQIRHGLKDDHATQLLKHTDCWRAVEANPVAETAALDAALTHEIDQGLKGEIEHQEPEKKPEPEDMDDDDQSDEMTGNMPILGGMTKRQMVLMAKREFNQDLDPHLKADDMRLKLAGFVNGAKQ